MCKHKSLVYLGIQRVDGFPKELTLYNCLDCQSTITVESENTRALSRVKQIRKNEKVSVAV